MIDFLANGLLVYFNVADVETLILLGYIFGSCVQLPFWIIAGIQDWKKHEIKGWLCLTLMTLTLIHAVLFSGWLYVAVIAVCSYFAFREKEIELIGQADFILFAHWATIYTTAHGSGCGMFMVASVVFLVCLLVYVLLYRDENGEKWKHGKMVPIFPPYVASVIISTVLQYKLGMDLFWRGF